MFENTSAVVIVSMFDFILWDTILTLIAMWYLRTCEQSYLTELPYCCVRLKNENRLQFHVTQSRIKVSKHF